MSYDLAISILAEARETALNNAPIARAEGDEAQAALCEQVAAQCEAAANILDLEATIDEIKTQ